MRFSPSWLLLLIVAAPACGLSEHETAPPQALSGIRPLEACPEAVPFSPEIALPANAVHLRARVLERFFVDECHHALLLEPLEILEGTLHEPVLAIVPGAMSEMLELDSSAVEDFLLEPDPEIPEAYRSLSSF